MNVTGLKELNDFRKYSIAFIRFADQQMTATDSDFQLDLFIDLSSDYVWRVLEDSWFPQAADRRGYRRNDNLYPYNATYAEFNRNLVDSEHFLLEVLHAYKTMHLVYQAYATNDSKDVEVMKNNAKYWDEAYQAKLADLTITSDFYDWNDDGEINEWEKEDGPQLANSGILWRQL